MDIQTDWARLPAVHPPRPVPRWSSCPLLLAALVVPAFAQEAPSRAELRAALQGRLGDYVQRQMADKRLPAVCLALLDRDPETGAEWTWATAFGEADPERRVAATADTVHRVASISKLFTATAVMVLVQRGELDLDAPVTRYLPDFAPRGQGAEGITLRHLLSHRAGLVRESPVGHYFDAEDPGLAATVASINDTELVYRPGDRFKYSNPGPGVAGAVIAAVTGKPFEDAVRELVLAPLGLEDSDFAPRPDLVRRTARGIMWTPDGRAIPTPDFPFGYGPAANLRSTVADLLAFARSWLPGAERRVLTPETQAAMWRVPFVDGPADRGCGLGFFLGALDGHRKVEHGGAVYGFASTLEALPDAGLAVAVVTTVDFANAVVEAIAQQALRGMLAVRAGKVPELPPALAPVGALRARALAGRFQAGEQWFDLLARDEELVFEPGNGVRAILRQSGDELVSDDRSSLGSLRLRVADGGARIRHRGQDWQRQPDVAPAECPPALRPLLGEYGWDFDVLVVFEDGGRLCVLIEWLVRSVLEPVGEDRFRFADGTMYSGDPVVFHRGADGRVTGVTVGGTLFPARPWPEGPFRIQPQRDVQELRVAFRGTQPPQDLSGLRKPELVDLATAVPGLQFDIKYASDDNFLGTRVYEARVARMQRPAAEALARAQAWLRERGYGLLVFDAYRPWLVTKIFWEATPPALRHFVADPGKGSRHNRGCAVDVSLVELASGAVVAMPSGYDEFTVRAYPDWPGGTARERWHRELLRRAMESAEFTVYEHEWWHFDWHLWREYPVLDIPIR